MGYSRMEPTKILKIIQILPISGLFSLSMGGAKGYYIKIIWME